MVRTSRAGAADAAVVHFFPSSLPWPANSALPPQTAAHPLQTFMPTHPPPHSRRPARNTTSYAATASLQGRTPNISLRTAQRSLRKRSEPNAPPGDWLRAAPIPRSPGRAGLSAARLVPAQSRAGGESGIREVGPVRSAGRWLVR